MHIDPVYWENQFQTWPPQEGESETVQTTRFLAAVRSSLSTESRLAVYQLEGFRPDEIDQVEEICRTHCSDSMESNPTIAASRAVEIYYQPARLSRTRAMGYTPHEHDEIEALYNTLSHRDQSKRHQFEQALRKYGDTRDYELKQVALKKVHEQLVEPFKGAGLSESDIPIVQTRWPHLPLPEAFAKYRESWPRFRAYQDAGIPESECLLVDTTYWKEGVSTADAITKYNDAMARFGEYTALGRSESVCPMIDTYWKPGMTATATIETYDTYQKFLEESAKRHTRYRYYESQGYDELCLSHIDHLWHGEPESLDVAIERYEAFKKKGEETVKQASEFDPYIAPSPEAASHLSEWEPTPTYIWNSSPPVYYFGRGYSCPGGTVKNGTYF